MNDIMILNLDSHKNVLFWDNGKLISICANCLPPKCAFISICGPYSMLSTIH